jgi:hypothetical protein
MSSIHNIQIELSVITLYCTAASMLMQRRTAMTSLSPLAARSLGAVLVEFLRAVPAPRRRRGLADEAAEVREFALSVRHRDPGFAADLLAAADRHELGGRA